MLVDLLLEVLVLIHQKVNLGILKNMKEYLINTELIISLLEVVAQILPTLKDGKVILSGDLERIHKDILIIIMLHLIHLIKLINEN